MATAKKTIKTPVKSVAKKAATKRAAPVAGTTTSSGYRVDYKAGARVKAKMPGGKEIRTFVDHIEQTKTGPFIYCNIGSKDLPRMKGFRPAAVKGF